MLFLEDFIVIPNETYTNYVSLPPSVLQKITLDDDFQTFYFELENEIGLKVSVGVKDFTTSEDIIEVPSWISNYLASATVKIKLIKDIMKGSFIKIEPQEEMFFSLPDNDILLETELSKYCLLENGQIIYLSIFDEVYSFKILDVQTSGISCNLIDITNVDIVVDIENKFLVKKPKKKVSIYKEPEVEIPKEEDMTIGGDSHTDIREARLAFFNKKFKK